MPQWSIPPLRWFSDFGRPRPRLGWHGWVDVGNVKVVGLMGIG
ncbi:hypothetical protein OG225_33950 [Nocardia sp. NBC_01377]